jgi:ABC-type Na+ transport system ATPase subunit NatA
VAIARALLHDPPVLLLDEPDTGLDVSAFGLLEQLVVGRNDRVVVLTTHHLSTGLRLGTRVAVLHGGRLVHQQATASTADAAVLSDMLERVARGG